MFKTIFPFLTTASTTNTAETPPPSLWDNLLGILPMIAIFGLLMYFMLYRPQKKQQKAAEDMRNSLKVGDEISTTSGIIGKVIQIKDDFLIIETGNDKTKLKIAKWAIRAVEHREEEEEEDGEE